MSRVLRAKGIVGGMALEMGFGGKDSKLGQCHMDTCVRQVEASIPFSILLNSSQPLT